MTEAIGQLVDAWGSLGGIFGFNPSTARVSALLRSGLTDSTE